MNTFRHSLISYTNELKKNLFSEDSTSPESAFVKWLSQYTDSPFSKGNIKFENLEIDYRHAHALSWLGYNLCSNDIPSEIEDEWRRSVLLLTHRNLITSDRSTFIYSPVETLGIAAGISEIGDNDLANWLTNLINKVQFSTTICNQKLYDISLKILNRETTSHKYNLENLEDRLAEYISIHLFKIDTYCDYNDLINLDDRILYSIINEDIEFRDKTHLVILWATCTILLNTAVKEHLKDDGETQNLLISLNSKNSEFSNKLDDLENFRISYHQTLAKKIVYYIRLLIIIAILLIADYNSPLIGQNWDFIEPNYTYWCLGRGLKA